MKLQITSNSLQLKTKLEINSEFKAFRQRRTSFRQVFDCRKAVSSKKLILRTHLELARDESPSCPLSVSHLDKSSAALIQKQSGLKAASGACKTSIHPPDKIEYSKNRTNE